MKRKNWAPAFAGVTVASLAIVSSAALAETINVVTSFPKELTTAYKAAYEPIAGRVIEVDTPGVTAINAKHFEYKRIKRPMFPLDEER